MSNPLNPDAIQAVMVKLFPHHVGIGPNTGLLSEAVARGAREHVESIVSAYLAVAQPVVSYVPDAHALRKAVEAVHNETYGAHGDLAHIAVNAYTHALHIAQPEVNSVPGVYDIGSPEPEGVDYVVECDEHGVAKDYLCSDAFSGYWSKTTDGTQWKGYQDGKVYMSWAELVRRVGPVKEVDDA